MNYIGKEELERQRSVIDTGNFPFEMKMVDLAIGGRPVTDYAPDFWLINSEGNFETGYITSSWWSSELQANIAMGWVGVGYSALETKLKVHLPDMYSIESDVAVEGRVVEIPFRESVNPNVREKLKNNESSNKA